MTAEEFKAVAGYDARQDDLERANCMQAGEIGHTLCGVCGVHKKPRFLCAHCMVTDKVANDQPKPVVGT